MTTENTAANYDYLNDLDLPDQSVASAGFTPTLIPEGVGLARLVEYIELGKHKRKAFKGKAKADAEFVRLTFELSGKKFPAEEYEVEGEKKTRALRMSVEVNIGTDPKSAFFKLFTILNWEQKYKHMAQMAAANVACKVHVKHSTSGEGADKKTYANLRDIDGWFISSPFRMDEEAGTSELIKVAPATIPTCVFLFHKPRLVDWQQMYIAGEKEDGKSKNWLQMKIAGAKNYPGSALEALVTGAGQIIEGEVSEVEEPTGGDDTEEAKKTPANKQKGDDLGEDI